MPRLTGNECECTVCGLVFKNDSGFQAHRVFDDPKRPDWDRRRCLTGAELRALGYEPNAKGRWRKPAPVEVIARMKKAPAA